MSASCIQCSDLNRTNQHQLKPFSLSINYESTDIITSIELPRKYTSAYRDISIGHDYNKKILQHDDVIKRQNHVVGEWVKIDGKYEIHLNVIVSSEENPDASMRNKMFCDKLGLTLESIAFAETTLLKLHPSLASTKIYIRFHSLEEKYDRTEYWHRLGYWVPDSMRDLSETPSNRSSRRNIELSNNDNSLKYKRQQDKDDRNDRDYKAEKEYKRLQDEDNRNDRDYKVEKEYNRDDNIDSRPQRNRQQQKPPSSCPMCPKYVPPNFIRH